MRFLCRIFLIFCMLFISASVQACSDFFTNEEKIVVSTIINKEMHKDEDAITTRQNNINLQCSQREENLLIGIRKVGNSFDINPNQLINIIPSQFTCLLTYIYTLAYLGNISKVIFSLLYYQIFPNAP